MPFRVTLSLLLFLLPAASWGQGTRLDPRSTLHITFPEDSPVSVVSADWGESTASARGGAMLLDLHTSLILRNSDSRRIRAVTLLVQAQEVTPGGKASVSLASLNAAPGETFPVRIDLSLLRPLQTGAGPLVEVGLDGVLFDDLSFFGPNELNSRRTMTVWEQEARRDREHFRAVLESGGSEGLRKELVASLDRQARRSGMDARIARSGRATAGGPERQLQIAFLDIPDSPLETSGGMVRVFGSEAHSPKLFLRNRSEHAVRSVEVGWMIKDTSGKEYVAGAMPLDIAIAPKQRTSVVHDASFRFTQPAGRPIEIDSITGYLNSVEFEDGKIWIPSRRSRLLTTSPEEQRLAELYRKKGLKFVMEELKKF